MRNPCGPCALKILKAKPRSGDGRGTRKHPPPALPSSALCVSVVHRSDLPVAPPQSTCVPILSSPSIADPHHPLPIDLESLSYPKWPVSRKTSGSLQEMAIWTESRLVSWFPFIFQLEDQQSNPGLFLKELIEQQGRENFSVFSCAWTLIFWSSLISKRP